MEHPVTRSLMPLANAVDHARSNKYFQLLTGCMECSGGFVSGSPWRWITWQNSYLAKSELGVGGGGGRGILAHFVTKYECCLLTSWADRVRLSVSKYMGLKPVRVIVTYILNKGYVMAPALISSPGGAARENNIIT